MPELDLEERLRDTVTRQSQAYNPSPDLPDLIHARLRDRRRRRTTVLGSVAAGVLVVGGLGAALVAGAGDPGTEVGPADSTTTTTTPTTVPDTTVTTRPNPTTTADAPTTTPSTTASTTTTPSTTTTRPEGPLEPSGTPVADDTPLDRAGIGPIEAGMTLRQVQEAGIPFTTGEPLAPDSTCNGADLDGTDLWLLLRTSGVPGADPLDAVVTSVQGATSTVEAVAVGQTREQLRAAYGEPTEVQEYPYLTDGTVEVFAEGRFAYSATLDGAGVITELESGLVTGVGNLEGCA